MITISSNSAFYQTAHFKALEDLQRDYVDLHLSYCGMEDVYPGFEFGPFIRTEYVLHIVQKGKGIFIMDNKTYHLCENQAFLIPPDVETFYKADAHEPWSYMWVGFNGIRAYETVTNAGFTSKSPVKTLSCTDDLHNYISQLLDAHMLTYSNELKRNGLLMQFWSNLIDEHAASDSQKDPFDYPASVYIKNAVHYMSLHYDKKIKIADLADHIGINRSYLTNSFKKVMKMSPQEYLISLRMEKAASLLKSTSLSIQEVALKVGYEDALAFSKIFRQNFGESPRSYREDPDILNTRTKKGEYFYQKPL